MLNHKSVQVCRFKVAKLISDDHELQSGLKLVQNSALSYDYYYLQAVLQQEDPLHVDLVRIDLLTRALEIAIDSDDASGVFLTILRLVQTSLLMATQVKYSPPDLMKDDVRAQYSQTLQTVCKNILYDAKLKALIDRFLAGVIQSNIDSHQASSQGGTNRVSAAPFEFQAD